MKGKLILVHSKREPVFEVPGVPIEIEFSETPQVQRPFLFVTQRHGLCHTSDVLIAGIDSETGDYALQTRNSLYKIVEVQHEREKS